MSDGISELVAINSDGTAVLSDGQVVRLIVGRHGIIGCRGVDVGVAGAAAVVPISGVDQIGKTPVPTMREALGG